MTTRGAASFSRLAMIGCAGILCAAAFSACDPGVRLGVRCELNSDCPEPLGCVLGRCREMCATARDCPSPAECLSTASGIAACSIAEQDRCESTASCATGLECVSGQCRQSCSTIACADGMRCGAAAVCEREDVPDAAMPDAGVLDASTTDSAIDAGECANPCDPVSGCGCPAEQRCGSVGGTVSCIAASGTRAIGEGCGGEAECGAGLGCYGGRCVEYCNTSTDCSGADVFCGRNTVAGAVALPSGYSLCSEECDILGDDSDCVSGTCSLGFVGGAVGEASYCRPTGALAVGATCAMDYECGAHATCEPAFVGGTPRFCRSYCVPGSTCGTGPCETVASVRGVSIGTCPP